MTDTTRYRALVEKIIVNGKHGPYCVARSTDIGPITFQLTESVWNEQIWPEHGTYVMLSGLMKKKAGWRASSARFEIPSDSSGIQQPEISKE